MAHMVIRFSSLIVFIAFLDNASAKCGYVDVAAIVEYGDFPVNLGEFTFSTDRCEALHAAVSVSGLGEFEYTVDGAIIFTCDPTDTSRVIVKEYPNLLCTGQPTQSSPLHINDKMSLFNDYLYFTMKNLSCTNTNCGVDITFSDDCRGIDSSKYTNLAFPVDSCQTFANDFGEGTFYFPFISSVAYEILPEATVDGLFQTGLQFKCCANDNSLLIYNYSDTSCDINSEYNTIRLSNIYNNTCFALGNGQKPFDISTGKANPDDIDIEGEQVYALKYTWTCDEYVNCDGIDFVDTDVIPNLCPDKCLEPGYSFSPTSSPTATPTFHPIAGNGNGNGNVNTVAPYNVHGSHLSGTSGLILIGVIIVVIIGVLAVIAFCVYNRRKMKRVVEESKQTEIKHDDPRYEPMITTPDYKNKVEITLPEGNTNTEIVKDNDAPGQYVMPSKVKMDGEDADDESNLLTQT